MEHEGKIYARVTDILKHLSDFSHIDPVVLARKSKIGTDVHKAIEDEINDEFPALTKDTRGYFESFDKWRARLEVKFIASEKRYFCKEKMITGQIDALILPPGSNIPVLVDFKTSSQESSIVWPMQAHLYGYLIQKNDRSIAPRYLFVKLDKHGGLPLVYQYTFDENVLAKCMEAIDNYWKNHPC